MIVETNGLLGSFVFLSKQKFDINFDKSTRILQALETKRKFWNHIDEFDYCSIEVTKWYNYLLTNVYNEYSSNKFQLSFQIFLPQKWLWG